MFTSSRVEAFSDGVFAIVITLLVLEFQLPDQSGGKSLAQMLWDLWPSRAVRLPHAAHGEVRRVSFSADGKRALSATYDDVRVWTLNPDGTVAAPRP